MARQSSAPPAAAVIQPRPDPKASYDAIMAAIEADRDKLVAALAAVHIKPERFLSVVDQALRREPKLLQCTRSSILKALLDAAELGLVPSGLIGQAYLVPYRNRHTNRLEAQLIPGYRGLCDLARRSGDVKAIEARVVRENDVLDLVHGTDGYVRHVPYINRTFETVEVPDPNDAEKVISRVKDGGRYIGAYMIATLTDGLKQVEWMPWAEIMGIKRRSAAAASGPWVTDEGEMAKKTVTRRGVKYLPVAIDSPLNRALALEDAAESNAAPRLAGQASDARKSLEGALGIGGEEKGDGADAPGATDGGGTDEGGTDEGGDELCGALSPDSGEPCLKPAGHEDGSHKSENEVWPQEAENGAG